MAGQGMNGVVLTIALMVGHQAPSTVPEGLREVAQSSPLEFVMALAHNGIPAGIELIESDDVLPPGWPTREGNRPAWYHLDRTRRVSLSELAATFNAHHDKYKAGVMGTVVVIRPAVARSAFLETTAAIEGSVTAEGAMAAARKVFVAIRPGLAGPIIGAGASRADDRGAISLDGRGSPSVVQVLNQIVAQDGAGPWRAWVVITREEGEGVRPVSFGFIGMDGARRTHGLPRTP